MSDLHWALRDHLQEFREDGRLFVLLSIYLHKNQRNRSWPANDLIRKETGLSRAPVSQSIAWLAERKALVLVPYGKRLGDEKKLPRRKNIYQLTGVIHLKGEYYPYLFMNPESWEGIIHELSELGESSICELLKSKGLPVEHSHSESSNSEHEGITSSLGITDKKKTAAKAARKSPSQKKPKDTPLIQLQGRLQPYIVLAAALLDLFDAGFKQAIHKPDEYLITIVQLEKYVPILEDLGALKATAEEVYAVHKYLKPGYSKNGWTIGLKTIVEKLPAFRVWRDNGGESRIITGVWGETDAPEIKDVGLTTEERRAIVANTKKAVSA